jgi:23S rRNA (cytosine1962-C5)-methyltransferase
MTLSKIIVHHGKERSVMNRHPWLFSGAVKKIEGDVKEGDVVEIFSADQRYLATGHYHEGSIKVRIFSFEQTKPDFEFWNAKLSAAFQYRKSLGFIDNPSTNCYRLVHAEGDGLPGLIIDIYNSVAVIQTHTIGMHNIKEHLVKSLEQVYEGKLKAIYDKSSDTMSRQQQSEIPNQLLMGDKSEEEVLENGIRFHRQLQRGTEDWFLSSTSARTGKLLGEYSAGKKVLNAFAYSGGFSLYALKNGASLVHSVDSSKKAGEWAEKNVALNFPNAKHQFFTEDVFDFLQNSKENV